MITIYIYDPETGNYLATREVEHEVDSYHYTLVEPEFRVEYEPGSDPMHPVIKTRYIPRWNGTAWDYVEDPSIKQAKINAIDAELEALERQYLTPRTLSDLALTPAPEAALERKRIFEEKAEPLRQKRREIV